MRRAAGSAGLSLVLAGSLFAGALGAGPEPVDLSGAQLAGNVTASPSGGDGQVAAPVTVRITLDGRTTERTTTQPTVRDALVEAGVILDRDDRLTPKRTVPLEPGMDIVAVRVQVVRTARTVAIPFSTEKRNDARLAAGTSKVLRAGVVGAERRTTEQVFADGALERTRVVAAVRTRAPRSRVVAVGTRSQARSAARAGTGRADGLNWPALARCESGGNPRAVSRTGKYRGLYQFSYATWRGVGGTGDPAKASPAQQTYRAKLLYLRSGRGPWPVCGRRL